MLYGKHSSTTVLSSRWASLQVLYGTHSSPTVLSSRWASLQVLYGTHSSPAAATVGLATGAVYYTFITYCTEQPVGLTTNAVRYTFTTCCTEQPAGLTTGAVWYTFITTSAVWNTPSSPTVLSSRQASLQVLYGYMVHLHHYRCCMGHTFITFITYCTEQPVGLTTGASWCCVYTCRLPYCTCNIY